MNCKKCGVEYDDRASRCPNCGYEPAPRRKLRLVSRDAVKPDDAPSRFAPPSEAIRKQEPNVLQSMMKFILVNGKQRLVTDEPAADEPAAGESRWTFRLPQQKPQSDDELRAVVPDLVPAPADPAATPPEAPTAEAAFGNPDAADESETADNAEQPPLFGTLSRLKKLLGRRAKKSPGE